MQCIMGRMDYNISVKCIMGRMDYISVQCIIGRMDHISGVGYCVSNGPCLSIG